jgi:hypothetical protein
MYEVPWWWSIWIKTCRQTYEVAYKIKSVHLLVIKVFITQKCMEQHISKSVYIVLVTCVESQTIVSSSALCRMVGLFWHFRGANFDPVKALTILLHTDTLSIVSFCRLDLFGVSLVVLVQPAYSDCHQQRCVNSTIKTQLVFIKLSSGPSLYKNSG